MRTRTIIKTLSVIALLGIFVFNASAARLIPKEISEVFLTGSLEAESNFNLVLTPGSHHDDKITLVNNTEASIIYDIQAVDSERNNQNAVVFKSTNAENPNLGKWVQFKQESFEVPAKGNLTIPFSIDVPSTAFPGTYYGGISIQKRVSSVVINASQSVKVNTRNVMKLTVSVPGDVKKDYQIGNFTFEKNQFHFDFQNQGNVLMTVTGDLAITGNGLGGSIKPIKMLPLRVLPGDSLQHHIDLANPPLLGSYKASFSGKVYYFDGVENKELEISNFNLETNFMIVNYQLLTIVGLILILIIIVAILRTVIRKKYLKESIEYIVVEGDDINSIAQKYNMHWEKLASLNHLHPPYTLTKGQKILVHNDKK
ncbi:DUF916 domain-containing protein [Candidatus Peregrinibacteria bacterium]|nr:DUF916 domain-containing protein [Candidatus Peregrinibacteria bacterium]